MSKFITLTYEDKPIVINLKYIVSIREAQNVGTVVILSDRGKGWYAVKESLEEIAKIINYDLYPKQKESSFSEDHIR